MNQDTLNNRGESLPLARFGLDYYYVFPTYGPEFRDMAGLLSYWDETFPDSHRFWAGFFGGGILAVPISIPQQQRDTLALLVLRLHHKPIYGLVLGNESGREFARCLSCALPEYVPAFAVKLGLAERVPDPTVKATVEHADRLGSERYLLVVPKANRKSLKLIERLPGWFESFGVTIDGSSTDVPPPLREEMHDWFGGPGRTMFAFRMSGGEANAAWQLAVIYYVAEYWETQAKGLDTMHLVTSIEGRPYFRKNWTSNK